MTDEELEVAAYMDSLSKAPAPYTKDPEQQIARYQDFNFVFGTQQGQRVLYEIYKQCGLNRVPFLPGKPIDPNWHLIADGKRSIALAIMGILYNEPRTEKPTTVNRAKEDINET